MIQYIIYFQIFVGIMCFIYKDYIKRGYNKALMLNNIRVMNNISIMNCISSIIYMMYMYIRMSFVMFLQRYVNSWCIKVIEKNLYEVQLSVGGKNIKLLLKVNRGPNSVLMIMDDKGNDISNNMMPYLNYRYIGCSPDVYNYKYIELIDVEGEIIRKEGESNIN